MSSSSPSTSATPPPPGFAEMIRPMPPPPPPPPQPSRSITPKTTSFNNLALALGTGLAECMDDSTNASSGGRDVTVRPTRGEMAAGNSTTTITTATTTAMAMVNANDINTEANNGVCIKAPGRIHTPDTYSRQSRHTVNRLIMNMGSSAIDGMGKNGLSGGEVGGGFLIPPVANYGYHLTKLQDQQLQQQKQQHQQQQQQTYGNNNMNVDDGFFSRDGKRDGINGIDDGISSLRWAVASSSSSSSSSNDHKYDNNDINSGQQDSMGGDGGEGGGGGHNVRFAAAMMANTGNKFVVNDNDNNPMSVVEQKLHRDLLHQQQQMRQQQQKLQQREEQIYVSENRKGISGAIGRNVSSTAIGLTVVEPPSNANSPAPQRNAGGGAGSGGSAAIGVGINGLLFPLLQQQQQQQQRQQQQQQQQQHHHHHHHHQQQQQQQQQHQQPMLATQGDVVVDYLRGRASAPPVSQSRQSSASSAVGSTGIGGIGYAPGLLRAYASSSLQLRVAELHQELGPRGGGMMMPTATTTNAPVLGATSSLPLASTPAPTPPPPHSTNASTTVPVGSILLVPSRPPSTDSLVNRHIESRSATTPLSTISSLASPAGPASVLTILSGHQTSNHLLPPAMSTSSGAVVASVTTNTAVDHERRRRELAAAQELAPFLRDQPVETGRGGAGGLSSVDTRGLAILYASSLHVQDVRSTCEAFGTLESFRSDFGESRGVFFASYYDLRSARLAVGELPRVLNRTLCNGSNGAGGNAGDEVMGGSNDSSSSEVRVQVKYCVPFNSSSATDESTLMLSNIPCTFDEQDLNQILSSFGEVRAIHYQANVSDEDEEGNELTSYLVEFYDIQDAKQALLELEHTHPWGDGVKIKVGARSPMKRKLGKDLVVLMSSWRQGAVAGASLMACEGSSGHLSHNDENTVRPTPAKSSLSARVQQLESSCKFTAQTSQVHCNHQGHQQPLAQEQETKPRQFNPMEASSLQQPQSYYQYPNAQNPNGHMQQYQLVVGQDGQYSYVLMNHSPTHYPQIVGHQYGNVGQRMAIDPHIIHHQHHQQMYAPALEQHYIHNQHQISPAALPQYQIQYNEAVMPLYQPGVDSRLQGMSMSQLEASINQLAPPTQFIRMPTNDVNSDSLSSASTSLGEHIKSAVCGMSLGGKSNSAPGIGWGLSSDNTGDDNGSNLSLLLSIDHVRSGIDRRSSLMVRNIPNKYTQQMLLAEFAATGHGSDKIDFFYLPIDFKNKCNRGYAFVNFVDYKDIIPFFSQYNKCGWKRFNSDKICDITYARIQGKAAMSKRFENSSLMEKDNEYRPMVFVSHGERKGQLENIRHATMSNGVNEV